MSTAAVLRGVEHFLLDHTPLTSREVGVRLRGRPPASGGQVYYGIYQSRLSQGPSRDQILGLDIIYGFTVAITVRTGVVPDDRIPSNILLATTTGLDDRVHDLITLLHAQRHAVLCYIHDQLPESSHYFVEPFSWTDSDPEPREVGPDWFSADPTGPDVAKYYGLVLESRFSGGRRLQSVAPLT